MRPRHGYNRPDLSPCPDRAEDFPRALAAWEESSETGLVFEAEYRFRRADGVYRWHLGRAVPVREADGRISSWVGAAVDIEDRKRAEEVLTNLVDNAVKYSPDGGPVRVRLEPGDGLMRFEVSDRGLGIPPAEHRRIFEKFYRLDPNMTRGIGGTGLGLYISRELVRTMEGRIRVDSQLGEGSTFVVEIPLARTRRGKRPPRQRAASTA